MEYRYPRFRRELLLEDRAFAGGPRPGERVPDMELRTPEGATIALGDLLQERPLLLTFGSFT